jgi:cyanuric acid amidohydrolase
MAEAGIEDADQVHYVQVKCPLLTSERMAATQAHGATVATYASMGLSRGASALGVAVALGEVEEAGLVSKDIGSAWDMNSGRASASAGVELDRNEVIVLSNSPRWASDLTLPIW